MGRNLEEILNHLLMQWHRWASSSVLVNDTRMRDFDAIVRNLAPRNRIAIVTQARNLAVGVTVYTAARASAPLPDARRALHNLLATDDARRWYGPRFILLNARGNRVGESHPKAGLSDEEVDLMLQLHEEGYGYKWLSSKFETPRRTVRDICNGLRRNQTAVRVKEEA